jgi:peptide-methionine (S)-S-oxide reductase
MAISELSQKPPISAILVALLLGFAPAPTAQQLPEAIEDVKVSKEREQTAVLAGGCFWGVEAVFERLNGVKDVISGFSGGGRSSASYEALQARRGTRRL